MSDFTSGFWDWYVAIITIVSVIACAVFLKSQSKARVKLLPNGEPESTAHVWDDNLREYQHPLPRWWVVLFYLTVVFGLGYLALFPGLGTQFKGLLGWTSAKELHDENVAAEARFGPLFEGFLARDIPSIAGDARAHQIGARIFLNNCAQCHGSDARGAKGFPNLTDEEWIWGGTPEAIETTITEGREAVMPPQIDNVGSEDKALDVANYVLSLSSSKHDDARAQRGTETFAAVCAACHGAQGKGNPELGAPDISNQIWTYGGGEAAILDAIHHGHHGVMPAHKDVLSKAQIHLVAAYVYSLSHGAAPAPAAVPAAPSAAMRP